MREIIAPNKFEKEPNETSIFLAGSTGIDDWRSQIVSSVTKKNGKAPVLFLNPLRNPYPKMVIELKEQFFWETQALSESDAAVYYFDNNSVAPLTLLEMGLMLNTGKPIFVGYDPHYSLYFEVTERLKIFRPDIQVAHSLEELAQKVNSFISEDVGFSKLASRRRK